MRITFLGTGTSQGVPVIGCHCEVCSSKNKKDKRLRSSVMVNTGKNNLIIDAGPDFRQQMLREKVERIDAVLITHGHKDHIGGLDDVRAFNYFQKGPVDVYAEKLAHKLLKQDLFYAFKEDKYPGAPDIDLHTISSKGFEVNGDKIIPIRAFHYKLPVLGFRIEDFTYITDANCISDKEIKKIIGSKVFVVNALRKQQHISHFSLEQAVSLIKKINPPVAYLTHISHQMGLQESLKKELPGSIRIAYDGLSFEM